MMRLIRSMAMAMGLLATVAGCGGGDGAASGSAAETTAACTAYCNAYVAKNCGAGAIYTDLNDCMTNDCDMAIPDVPDRCQAKLKAYYVCRKAQSDLCGDSGCGTELSAAGTCM
jgi:hypothetical protein